MYKTRRARGRSRERLRRHGNQRRGNPGRTDGGTTVPRNGTPRKRKTRTNGDRGGPRRTNGKRILLPEARRTPTGNTTGKRTTVGRTQAKQETNKTDNKKMENAPMAKHDRQRETGRKTKQTIKKVGFPGASAPRETPTRTFAAACYSPTPCRVQYHHRARP